MFLRKHDFGDGASVYGESLEELRTGAHCFRVLHDDPYYTGAGAIGDLDPVPAVTYGHDPPLKMIPKPSQFIPVANQWGEKPPPKVGSRSSYWSWG